MTSRGIAPFRLSGVPFLVSAALEAYRFSVSQDARGEPFLEEANTTDMIERSEIGGKTDARFGRRARHTYIALAQLCRFRLFDISSPFTATIVALMRARLIWETCNVFTDGNGNKNMTSRCDGIWLR